jgi:hypothetical protein
MSPVVLIPQVCRTSSSQWRLAKELLERFGLAMQNSTLGRWWRGSVAEILIYDGVLTSANLNSVGYYFQAKYNLPTNFASPAPLIRNFTAATENGIVSEGGVLSASAAPVTLSWSTQNATLVSIDNGVLQNSGSTDGTVAVSPSATTTYTLTATNALNLTTTKTVTVYIGVTPLPPRINEFLAENESGLQDVDGDFSDWIEIYNPNAYGITLEGYRLRDSTSQWNFPTASSIPANGFRVIFASGKNLRNPAADLHTNFSLENSGEYLSLVRIGTG